MFVLDIQNTGIPRSAESLRILVYSFEFNSTILSCSSKNKRPPGTNVARINLVLLSSHHLDCCDRQNHNFTFTTPSKPPCLVGAPFILPYAILRIATFSFASQNEWSDRFVEEAHWWHAWYEHGQYHRWSFCTLNVVNRHGMLNVGFSHRFHNIQVLTLTTS